MAEMPHKMWHGVENSADAHPGGKKQQTNHNNKTTGTIISQTVSFPLSSCVNVHAQTLVDLAHPCDRLSITLQLSSICVQ